MLYLVVGMHKSGTTAVAEILHKSGIAMGDQLDDSKDYVSGNKYERLSTQELNKDMLQCHDVESLAITLPPNLQLTAQQRRAMRELLNREETGNGNWGFKDPRTCLTYPLWQPLLPPHRIILVYRHPVQVYLHYRNKSPGNKLTKLLLAGKILRSWTLHNGQLTTIASNADVPCLILSYERLMREQAEFDRLEAFIGSALVDARKKNYYQRGVQRSAIASVADLIFGIFGAKRPFTVWKQLEKLRMQQL